MLHLRLEVDGATKAAGESGPLSTPGGQWNGIISEAKAVKMWTRSSKMGQDSQEKQRPEVYDNEDAAGPEV